MQELVQSGSLNVLDQEVLDALRGIGLILLFYGSLIAILLGVIVSELWKRR